MSKQLKADILLLLVAISWGSTFVITKNALIDIPTYNFLAIRFVLSFIITSIIYYKKMIKVDSNTIKYGIIIGIVLFLGYALQTLGLNYTTASKSGFITGFSVIIVPIFSALYLKQKPNTLAIIGSIFAIIGLGFMTLNSSLIPNIGDCYTFFGAFAFAFHIILVGKYTVKSDSEALAIVQIGVVGFLSLITSLISEDFTIPKGYNIWINILIISVFATSLAYVIQNKMQKFTSPTHTALIYTGEPVFSAIFAYFLLNEIMNPLGIVGGVLIVFGMIISEIKGGE